MAAKQSIVNRREALHARGLKAYEAARKAYEAAVGEELAALKAECGASRHVFATQKGWPGIPGVIRACVYCEFADRRRSDRREPVPGDQAAGQGV